MKRRPSRTFSGTVIGGTVTLGVKDYKQNGLMNGDRKRNMLYFSGAKYSRTGLLGLCRCQEGPVVPNLRRFLDESGTASPDCRASGAEEWLDWRSGLIGSPAVLVVSGRAAEAAAAVEQGRSKAQKEGIGEVS